MRKPQNLMVVPAGGWKVTFPTGHVVCENHPSLFLQRCHSHMDANNIGGDWVTSGGWQDRIWNEVVKQNPLIPYVDEEDAKRRAITADDVKRFVRTMIEAREQGATPVSDEEQARRIDICLVCPMKTVVGCGGGCGWLNEALNWFSLGRKAKKIPEVHKQHCGACGCDLALKSQYPLDVLKSVDLKLGVDETIYHENCWMRGN